MWPKEYKDYKIDEAMIKNKVEPGQGIIGSEMHEINGWGNTLHHLKKKKKRKLLSLFTSFFSKK